MRIVVGLKLFLVMVLVMTGCEHSNNKGFHQLDPGKLYRLDYASHERGVFVSQNEEDWKSCAEPPPDTAQELLRSFIAKLEAKGMEVELESVYKDSVVKLAERTELVQLLREALFRICEASINNSLNGEQVIQSSRYVYNTMIALVDPDSGVALIRISPLLRVLDERFRLAAEEARKRGRSNDLKKTLGYSRFSVLPIENVGKSNDFQTRDKELLLETLSEIETFIKKEQAIRKEEQDIRKMEQDKEYLRFLEETVKDDELRKKIIRKRFSGGDPS